MLYVVDVEGAVEVLGGPVLFVSAWGRAFFAVAGIGGQGGTVVVLADGVDVWAVAGAWIGVRADLEAGGP